ncbi:hypothetical protein ACFSTI_08885 [Rhizorhabdus histidinilytica]
MSAIVAAAGGRVLHVALTLSDAEQERRLVAADRAAFGKLRSVELLRSLRPGLAACLAAMPAPTFGSTAARRRQAMPPTSSSRRCGAIEGRQAALRTGVPAAASRTSRSSVLSRAALVILSPVKSAT